MFVIGGYRNSTCEIFDSYSRTFCYIKTCSDFPNNMGYFQAVCIGNCITIFGEVRRKNETNMFTYNDETGEWKIIDCSFSNKRLGFSCVKYHE